MDLDRGYMDVFDVDRRVGESSAGLDVGCKNTLSDLSIIGRVEGFFAHGNTLMKSRFTASPFAIVLSTNWVAR